MFTGVWISCLIWWMTLPAGQQYWVLASHSVLRVDGKTNINSFNCEVPNYGRTDTIWTMPGIGEKVKAGGELSIQVGRFDCHHKIMTKDLQKTLKATDYPFMKIRFLGFDRDLSKMIQPGYMEGEAEIELAGVTRRMTISFAVNPKTQGYLQMVGTKQILFSDFQLKPPSKLGGDIKVKNELLVEFKLYFKPML